MTQNSHHPVIGFIGAGNMTRCLISGLIANEYPASHIWASNPSPEKLQYLQHQFHVQTTNDNTKVIEQASIIVLAVKPQTMQSVVKPLARIIQSKKPLIISIAASITEAMLRNWIGDVAIVRCMPNIPAFVGTGATGMYANSHVSALQRDVAESVLRSVGITLWVKDEKLIDTIAALSGSGPAYFFLVMEALENAAVQLGLSKDDAHLLTLQTALGAARIAMSTDEPIVELRQRVTSKGGMTEHAIAVLESMHLRDAFSKALIAAHDRSSEVAKELSGA